MSAVGRNLKLRVAPYIKYPGAKWTMANWIIQHMPPHQIYLEPFVGAGAVFFNKDRSDIETLNDLNGDIVNLFRVMRERLADLCAAIEMTPWSREEFDTSYERDGLPDIERARKFLVLCWQSHKMKLGQRTGWKKESTGLHRKNYTREWDRLPERLRVAAERLKEAQIEKRCGLEIISRHRSDRVLIYADPPYILSTRSSGLYRNEMAITEHETLLRLLCDHPGPVLLSALEHDLYSLRLKGWEKKTFRQSTSSGRQNDEILWINPAAARGLRGKQ